MAYDLFLLDLDDTLLDFSASERLSFFSTMRGLGIHDGLEELYAQYQIENSGLWLRFERAQTTKEHLKVQRFRTIFEANRIAIDPEIASVRYLDTLPETVVLVDGAVELCAWLSARGQIGIVTNGIEYVQTRRIRNSAIAPYIGFVSVSEACGFAKPDVRFFEHSVAMARTFSKPSTLVVGDRIEADILGAQQFGIDSCWFNPTGSARPASIVPTYEISQLAQLRPIVEGT